MKRIVVIVMIGMIGMMIVNPSLGYSNSFDRGQGYGRPAVVNNYHYDRQPARPYNNVRYARSHDNNSGLLIAGAALGAIVLGAVLGSVMSQPSHTTPQQVIYGGPPPGSPAYAQPSGYGTSYAEDIPPGQWVTVPGQWVDGQWIPAHKVWVPVNP